MEITVFLDFDGCDGNKNSFSSNKIELKFINNTNIIMPISHLLSRYELHLQEVCPPHEVQKWAWSNICVPVKDKNGGRASLFRIVLSTI